MSMTDECGPGDGRRPVSRRRFLASTAGTGLAAALAGCPIGGRRTPHGATVTERSESETVGTTREPTDDSTVRWAFEPLTEAEGDAIARALHDHGLSTDVDVRFEPGDPDPAQRLAEFDQALASDEDGPDVFLVESDWVIPFAARDQLAELSALVSEERLAESDGEYFEALAALGRSPDGETQYGVPVAADFGTMLYRKDLVEAAGYDPVENDWATEPMTWEEWSNVAADVTDHAGVDYGFTTQWDIYEGTACCTFNEVMSSWGGAYFGGRDNLFGPVGERPITVGADPVVRSLNMMRKFVHDEGVSGLEAYAGGFAPTEILGWIEEGSRVPFTNGDAVFHRNWASTLTAIVSDLEDGGASERAERIGAIPLPYAVTENEARADGTGGTTSAVRGRYVTVDSDSQDRDAVAQVLEVVTDPGFQTDLVTILGWLPPRPALYESGDVWNTERVGEYAPTFGVVGANAMPAPVTRVWNDQASLVAQQANRAVGQEVSSSKAMADLASNLEPIERSA